jgi:predicted dinucleotide-binding enzyme
VKIALLGGTGSFGSALAVRLAEAGYDVVIGSRDAERAAAAAAAVGAEGATNEEAAR